MWWGEGLDHPTRLGHHRHPVTLLPAHQSRRTNVRCALARAAAALFICATLAACTSPAADDLRAQRPDAAPAIEVEGAVDVGGAPAFVDDAPTAPAAMPDAGSAAAERDDTGWREVESGIVTRVMAARDGAGTIVDRPFIVRVDPATQPFDVAYRPGTPQSLAAWQAETGATVVVNGGYFTEENVATGLIVAGGIPSGASYGDFAGMFAVTDAGPEVRWLAERPFDPAEALTAAVQSFPILVRPDGTAAYPEDNGEAARRTVIGQDRAGRIVLIVMPLGGFSLHALSEWLAAAVELDLRIAFNLDGGASSGLLMADGSGEPALVGVPAVILVGGR